MSYTALHLCTSVTLYHVFCVLDLVSMIRVEGTAEAEYDVRMNLPGLNVIRSGMLPRLDLI